MNIRKALPFSIVVLSLALSACSPTQSSTAMQTTAPTSAMLSTPTTAMPGNSTTPAATPDAMMSPTWLGTSLTNVNKDEKFSINDFKGKVVLVEMMAQWCINCKQQQGQIKALHTKMGMTTDLVTVDLDIDPNEKADTLKTYTATNGFDWIYAVAPTSVSHEVGQLYGDQFLNPTATPILIVDRKGVAHPLPFGIKSADDLMKAVNQYLNAM